MKTAYSHDEVKKILPELGNEFVIINNPSYIYAGFEICPVAPKISGNRDEIVAIVQDMDGTTTTTENLCLYSLETMVRQFTGCLSKSNWIGLDKEKDYPHIIGNSTTKHVEYLIKTYQDKYDSRNFSIAFLYAALITITIGRDENRKCEVLANLAHFGCSHILEDSKIQSWQEVLRKNQKAFPDKKVKKNIQIFAEQISITSFSDQVRAAIDIYYQKYHEILAKIEKNDIDDLKRLLPPENQNFIEPMAGVGIFLATVKGWLGEDLDLFFGELKNSLTANPELEYDENQIEENKNTLINLGRYFQRNPVKFSIVTSSIAYEANIVLTEVFNVLRKQIETWSIDNDKKEFLINKFSDYRNVFDGVITASDSSEIRLKPHRDLYSMALHHLGVAKNDFDKVIGFEDSESGLISIRAAGIGLCVAVPFADTQGHNLNYASHILKGGLPEAILMYRLFLSKNSLENN